MRARAFLSSLPVLPLLTVHLDKTQHCEQNASSAFLWKGHSMSISDIIEGNSRFPHNLLKWFWIFMENPDLVKPAGGLDLRNFYTSATVFKCQYRFDGFTSLKAFCELSGA
jgi:hypothetical protein